jgi:hypothetical protein
MITKIEGYEIRRWNAQGAHTWELWRTSRTGRWPCYSYVQEKLSTHNSESDAVRAMSLIIPGHYDQFEYYDDKGDVSGGGW